MQSRIIFIVVLIATTAIATLTQDVVHVTFDAFRIWVISSPAKSNG